jgi:hypothetical protein
MKYECPSCYMSSEDAREPHDRVFEYVCKFCALPHDEKALLDWQIQHISNIKTEKLRFVIKNIYKYFELQLSLLKK